MKIFKRFKPQPAGDDAILGIRKPSPPKVHKHQILVPFATFVVLGLVSGLLFFFYGGTVIEGADVKRVQVYVDGQNRTLPTRAQTVGELLSRIGIQLDERDIVEPGVNSPIFEDDLHINVYRAKPVTVIDEDGRKVSARIAESSPESLAKKAGFEMQPEDKAVFAAPDEAVQDGVVGDLITIKRAIPVTLNLYGNPVPVRTQAETVGDLLKEKNIQAIQGDNIYPSAETPIQRDMQIFIVPDNKQVAITEEPVAPPTETRLDATLDVGVTKVIDPGVPGKKVVVYEVEIVNGQEVGRKAIQAVIAVQPQKRVVVAGAKSTGFGGDFGAALSRLRSCEGSYSSNTGNGYYGAYQFNAGTWRANAPAAYKDTLPHNAPPTVQDQAAATLYQRRGWQPWPACSRKLGLQDVYR